jgi:predicted dithiol-disulfide oxidoreductase (DUF899 family)
LARPAGGPQGRADDLLMNLKRKIGWNALWAGPNTEKQYDFCFNFLAAEVNELKWKFEFE